jgi:membrane associated rhomboid family serine protease
VSTPEWGAPVAPAVPHCYRHPDRETYVSCTRCGRPICPECMIPASVGHQCPHCVNEGAKTVRQPRTITGAALRSGMPVTWILVAVNVVVYLATSISGISVFNSQSTSSLYAKFALVPGLVDQRHGGEDYRLITGMFLHYSIIHIAFNMYALVIMGMQLEPLLGRWRYLSLYFLAGLGGSVATYLFANPYVQEAGASGAIFGLFAAFFVIARKIGADTRPILFTIGLNLVITLAIPGISKTGHLGGLVVGAGVAALFTLVPRGPRRTLVQVAGCVALLAVMAGLVLGVHVLPVNLA